MVPTEDTQHRALLIDLDNCPHELLQLRETADHYRFIIACHGTHEPRVPLGMVAILGELLSAGRVEVMKMPAGKNAADFGLTFFAGRLSCLVPAGTVFHIASKDRDLDFAIGLLRDFGWQAQRLSKVADAVHRAPTSVEHRSICSLCKHIVNRDQRQLPKRRKSLNRYVKANEPRADDWTFALAHLEDTKAIIYSPAGEPQYDVKKMRQTLEKEFPLSAADKLPAKLEKIPAIQLAQAKHNSACSQKNGALPGRNSDQPLLFELDDEEAIEAER